MRHKYTCADCENHICTSLCRHVQRLCDGICTKKDRKTRCYGSVCKEFKALGIPEQIKEYLDKE